jgi:hypothetical protein
MERLADIRPVREEVMEEQPYRVLKLRINTPTDRIREKPFFRPMMGTVYPKRRVATSQDGSEGAQ